MNGDPRKPQIAAAQTYFAVKTRIAEVGYRAINQELLLANISAAFEQALIPITQKLEQIEQHLSVLPSAKPKCPWTLPSDTPQEQVPQDYMQIENGSWLSPEAYESILRQSQRSLLWELKEIMMKTQLMN